MNKEGVKTLFRVGVNSRFRGGERALFSVGAIT